MSVVVVGDVVTDVLAVHSEPLAIGSDTPAQVTTGGGGSGANTAAWLAALGVPVTLVAVVGGDQAGEARIAELKAAGVRCAVRRVDATATGTVVVVSDGTERTMLCDRGANLLLTAADVDASLPAADHLHLSGYTLLDERSRPAGRHALAAAIAAGITTSVDAASAAPLRRAPDFLAWVRGTDLLFANLDEATALVGAGPAAELATRLAAGVRNAVVKSGPAGAVWAKAGAVPVHVPAIPAPMVDPTGAGDAFAAGVIGAWLGGRTRIDALLAGAEAGARAVSLVGGRPPLPL